MSTMDLGTMIARLSLDTGDFDSKKDSATSGLKDLGNQFGIVGKIAAGAGIGIILADITRETISLGKVAVQTGVDYELTMLKIKTITASTAEQMAALNNAAERTGRAVVASQAMLELGERGITTAEQLKELPAVMDFMLVHTVSAGQAVQGLIEVLDAYHLSADKASYVTDIFTGLMRTSREPIQAVQQQFASLSAISSSLGYSINETAADLVLLGEGGYKGERAATNLGTAMRRAVVVGEGYRLGTSDINKQLEILKKRGYDAGDIVQIYGGKMGVAAGVLSVMIDKFGEASKEVDEFTGKTHKAADTMQDNGARAFKQFGEAAATTATKVWHELSPIAEFMAKLGTNLLGGNSGNDSKLLTYVSTLVTLLSPLGTLYHIGVKNKTGTTSGDVYGPEVPEDVIASNLEAKAEADSKIIKPTEREAAESKAWKDIVSNQYISASALTKLWGNYNVKAYKDIYDYSVQYAKATDDKVTANKQAVARITQLTHEEWKSIHDATYRGVDETTKAYELQTKSAHISVDKTISAWDNFVAERRKQIQEEQDLDANSPGVGPELAASSAQSKIDAVLEQRRLAIKNRGDEDLNARLKIDQSILDSAETTSAGSKAAWTDYYAASKQMIDEEKVELALLGMTAKQQNDYVQTQLDALRKEGFEKTGQYMKLWSVNLPTTMQQNFSNLFFDVISAKVNTWKQLWLSFADFLKSIMDSAARAIADDIGKSIVDGLKKAGVFKYIEGLFGAGASSIGPISDSPINSTAPIVDSPINVGGGGATARYNNPGITVVQNISTPSLQGFQSNSQQMIQRAMVAAQVNSRRAGLAA